MQPQIDTALGDGRYRLQQRLGAGGMATVWLATDERLGRPVAVKIVADTLAGDEQWLRRFRREARAAAALSHRGVVPVFDYGVQDGRPYLVMEYVPGGTLAEALKEGSRPSGAPAPRPEQLARELLEALAAVHAAGILHRDIKPGNLLLDDHGHVRLTDFGIAQSQDSTALTRTGMVIGTVRYLAPEVAAGEPASICSDLYSAGVVIRQAAGDPPPHALQTLIGALTADDPAARPASAADALRLLDARPAATARGPRRDPTTRLLAPAPRRSRTPLYGLALLAAVAVVVVVLVLALGGGGGPTAPRPPAPASAGTSVTGQVQALERIVSSATRH